MVGVYVSGDIEQKLRKVKRWMKDKAEGVKTIIGAILMQEQAKKVEE